LRMQTVVEALAGCGQLLMGMKYVDED